MGTASLSGPGPGRARHVAEAIDSSSPAPPSMADATAAKALAEMNLVLAANRKMMEVLRDRMDSMPPPDDVKLKNYSLSAASLSAACLDCAKAVAILISVQPKPRRPNAAGGGVGAAGAGAGAGAGGGGGAGE